MDSPRPTTSAFADADAAPTSIVAAKAAAMIAVLVVILFTMPTSYRGQPMELAFIGRVEGAEDSIRHDCAGGAECADKSVIDRFCDRWPPSYSGRRGIESSSGENFSVPIELRSVIRQGDPIGGHARRGPAAASGFCLQAPAMMANSNRPRMTAIHCFIVLEMRLTPMHAPDRRPGPAMSAMPGRTMPSS
jgi:hypothetical protein